MYAAEVASTDPDRLAITMGTSRETLTYGELEDRANRLAHLFRAQGLRRGDHVAYVLENHLRYIELMAAAERAGIYYTCINSHLTAAEIAYIVRDSQARVLISSPLLRESIVEAAKEPSSVGLFLEVGEEDAGRPAPLASYEDAIAAYPSEPIADEQLGASMLYTSGTTGRPKGVLRPLPADAHPSTPLPVFDYVHKFLFRLREGMTYLAPTPLYHSAPQSAISGAIRRGSHSIVMERFDPEQFLQLIEEFRVTHTQVVPTMFHRLARLPQEVREKYDLSSLEVIVHSAAPCPEPLKRQMIDWFGPIIFEYYAATEAVGGTFITSEEWLAHPGSVGRPSFGELEIRDDDGHALGVGEVGRIWFGGASSFEYFNAPEKTRETFDGTGSAVGDLGFVDDEGYLYLRDRETFMIISGGVNIYPQETESALFSHPAVVDAAVFGVPDEDLGEVPIALVVTDGTGSDELAAELIAHLRSQLSTLKIPRRLEFVDALPRTAAGKLLKATLRDDYLARLAPAEAAG